MSFRLVPNSVTLDDL